MVKIPTPKGCGRHIHAVTSPAHCFSADLYEPYLSDDWDAPYEGKTDEKCGKTFPSGVSHGKYRVIWLCIECCVKAGLIW